MNYLLDIPREIALLTLRVAPYFLLGAAAGAALQGFVSHRWAGRLWGGPGLRPLISAISVAAVLPGCFTVRTSSRMDRFKTSGMNPTPMPPAGRPVVYEVSEVMKIRTGQRGDAAI